MIYVSSSSYHHRSFFIQNYNTIFKPVIISYSYKFIYYFFSQILENEVSQLLKDIKSVNKMFIFNTCSRFMNEFNILLYNSLEFDTSLQNQQCLITAIVQFLNKPETPHLLNDLIFEQIKNVKTLEDKYYSLVKQNYKQIIKQFLNIGPSLQEIIEFTQDDFIYNKKLRGFHPHRDKLIDFYQSKLDYINDILTQTVQKETIQLFSNKINEMIMNPQITICNNVISKNNINFQNFKENFITLTSISIKDWTNNLLNPINGVIAVHTQNLAVKSFYVFTIVILLLIFTVFCIQMKRLLKKIITEV